MNTDLRDTSALRYAQLLRRGATQGPMDGRTDPFDTPTHPSRSRPVPRSKEEANARSRPAVTSEVHVLVAPRVLDRLQMPRDPQIGKLPVDLVDDVLHDVVPLLNRPVTRNEHVHLHELARA